MRERVQQHVRTARERALELAALRPALVPVAQLLEPLARPPAAPSQRSTASGSSSRKMPSPRFSTAGNQLGSSARSARSTSLSYSPLMSGVTASKRVNPISASTSRRRWSWTTAAIAVAQRRARASARSGSRRAWKSGSTGTSSPNPSGAASSASSSTCLTGRSAAPPPLARSIAASTSSSPNAGELRGDRRLLLHERQLRGALDDLRGRPRARSTTFSRPVAWSGSESALITCGK